MTKPAAFSHPARMEMAAALTQSTLDAAARLGGPFAAALMAGCPASDRPASQSRVFEGTSDQVRAVRQFIRTALPAHPALDDAVLVASELAANAVGHTASGNPGGFFLVHVTVVSPQAIAVLVTDQGSGQDPRPQDVSADDEAGRGLAIVTALASMVIPFGGTAGRTILAVAGRCHHV
ncbi:MAG TPA: ATP-binding protein [Streptosporangiaceae bacterium]|nr:ATP-binding protein [Streptosporangiaceae bacterium]